MIPIRSPRRMACAGLALVLAAAPARAGFMDSVGNFFSGITGKVKSMFGGGSGAGASGGGELAKELEAVEASQKSLHDIQKQIIEKYNADGSAVNADDPATQKLLDELADKSRANEDLYLALLKKRAELVDKKVDVSKVKDRLATAQENQRRLEEGYQKIQDFNKESGFFEPPPAAQVASAKPGVPADFLNDPRVHRWIDEWLASQGLDGFGRKLGPNIKANYNPDTDGRTRHRYVWENYWQKTGLGAYVMAKLNGEDPALPEPPATQEPLPITVADSGTGTAPAATDPGGTGDALVDSGRLPAGSANAADLQRVKNELALQVNELQILQQKGQAQGPRGKELYESIKALQARQNALIQAGSGS